MSTAWKARALADCMGPLASGNAREGPSRLDNANRAFIRNWSRSRNAEYIDRIGNEDGAGDGDGKDII